MSGSKIEIMKENGNIIACMEKERLPGWMEDLTRDSMNMIRNTDLEHFTGLIIESTLGTGRTENNMAGVSTSSLMDRRKSDNGFKVRK